MKWLLTYRWLLILPMVLAAAISCEDPYEPEVLEQDHNFLVVEGHLNDGETSIILSRTAKLKENSPQPETGAMVTVESTDGSYSAAFAEEDPGVYRANLQLDMSRQYRLLIRTTQGSEFESDALAVVNSPVLDQLEWEVRDGHVEIRASSLGNAPEDTRFYRYTFIETWEYTSQFMTSLQYKNGDVIPLPPAEQYYRCYKSESSHAVNVTSTRSLTENSVVKALVTKVSPMGTNRINIRYSILVHQYGITREAYEFYERLKANTENLGTLFDPQPSMLVTNLHGTNNEERVIGYITAGSVSEQRLFIARNELPFSFYNDDYANCTRELIPFPMAPYDYHYYFKDGQFLPVSQLSPTSYLGGSPGCVDCRLQGGVTAKPAFW